MKKLILLISIIWVSTSLFSQEKKFYEVAQKQEAVYVNLMELTDPDFPESIKSGDPYTDKDYLNKLEEYAKLHPPCPIIRHTGNDELDKIQLQEGLNKWLQYNSYFPRYIPYHLFNRLLTPDDDLVYYQAGVNAWLDKNADKVNK